MTAAVLAGQVNMGPGEKLNLSISFVQRLNPGETIQAPAVVTLRDMSNRQLYPTGLSGVAQIATPLVTQVVQQLKAGRTYLLDVVVATTTSQSLQGQILITCEGEPNQL